MVQKAVDNFMKNLKIRHLSVKQDRLAIF